MKAARPVLAKVRDDIFTHFHALTAKCCSRTHNSLFGLLGPVLHATTAAVQMVAPVWNILDTTLYVPTKLSCVLQVLECGVGCSDEGLGLIDTRADVENLLQPGALFLNISGEFNLRVSNLP
jgi:hypothetical protein